MNLKCSEVWFDLRELINTRGLENVINKGGTMVKPEAVLDIQSAQNAEPLSGWGNVSGFWTSGTIFILENGQ